MKKALKLIMMLSLIAMMCLIFASCNEVPVCEDNKHQDADGNLISKHIEIILNSVPYDGILYFALLEMVLEYCFVTNQVVNFIEYYNEFKENNNII